MNPQGRGLPLKQAVQEKQQALELDAARLDALLALQQEVPAPDQVSDQASEKPSDKASKVSVAKPRSLWLPLGAVASLSLAFVLGWSLSGSLQQQVSGVPVDVSVEAMSLRSRPDVLARIADEVVDNHLQLKPMEVVSGQMSELRRFFDQLDFHPVQSLFDAALNRTLLGGRYCSIQGGMAAQLRMQSGAGELSTLYETRYYPERMGAVPDLEKGEVPLERVARGVRVLLWREQGLLFVMAGTE